MTQTQQVTVIIPNYNGKELLKNCIETLEHQTYHDFKLLVVDNGSTDGSTKLCSDKLDFEMIALAENTGFCGAVNVGIKHTTTPYFILLNNDTEVEPHFVEELLSGIQKSDRIFSCGAQMLDFRRREIIDNAGDWYTILGWAVARGKGKPAADFEKERDVFSCCGGAVIYRTDVVGKIGLFDENHFAYLEDVDMGYRARIYGYRNCYVPGAKVYHVGSATTGTRYNEKKVFLAARNSIFLIYKNMPLLQQLLNLPFVLTGILIKWLFFLKKGLGSEYLRGIKEGIRGCKKCRKVPFRMLHLGNYIRIELELICNVFRIIFANFAHRKKK
ncbi:MAG: glycosyltransferase family 2 protein [Roseburia sp.]|nr:glycosyltransferase family 2 protein [Roseburia sp.]